MICNQLELKNYLKKLGIGSNIAGCLARTFCLKINNDPHFYRRWRGEGVINPIEFPIEEIKVHPYIMEINDCNFKRYSLGDKGLQNVLEVQKKISKESVDIMNNIYEHIRKAKIQAEKEYIKANTIIIDKDIAIANNLWYESNPVPPMIFGMKVEYSKALPNDINFAILEKHEQKQNLEEILGIDPIIVLNALQQGITTPSESCVKHPRLYYSDDFNCWCFEIGLGAYVVKLKDYEVTWRLFYE